MRSGGHFAIAPCLMKLFDHAVRQGASVVSHAEVYNMICVSYAARYVDEQRGISGNA